MESGGFNPWVSMWTQPRQTIRALMEHDPRYRVLFLATLYAMQNLFYIANFYSMGLGNKFILVLVAILFLSPFIGALWLYYTGWILTFTGRWLGGKGSSLHLRLALAWSDLPLILSVAMWFILLASSSDTVFVQSAIGTSLVFVNFIMFIVWIWSFILLVASIREVQGFSALRAIANVLLSSIISFLIVFVVSTVVGMIFLKSFS